MTDDTPLGSIRVSPRAIASIAYQAAVRSYGVVGLAPKNVVNGLTNIIVKDPARGVDVHYDGEMIDIDLYIVVEYGTNIKSVSGSVANTVRYNVERIIGVPLHTVNVHVTGLRISDQD